jgi:hypothetical protein
MAQGKDHSFLKLDDLASRFFNRYRKGNQEQKAQESEGPHVSEFTIIWDKLSKLLCALHAVAIKIGRCNQVGLIIRRAQTLNLCSCFYLIIADVNVGKTLTSKY